MLSQEPPVEGKRLGWACASSKLAMRPSTSRGLFSQSVSSRVSAVSALPNIGQENFVRVMVGFSLGMVSKVLNPRALSLGQSLAKAAPISDSDRETSALSLSLVRSLVVFLSASLLSLSIFNARAQLIRDVLRDFSRQKLSVRFPVDQK
jgi:hypothetical protein